MTIKTCLKQVSPAKTADESKLSSSLSPKDKETEDQQKAESSSESPPTKKLKIENPIESAKTEVNPSTRNVVDKKEGRIIIKNLFLVDMPDEFYSFWDMCVKLNPKNPLGLLI